MKKEIKELVVKYAEVYKSFEKLQESGVLPGGDQKTGVIAEFYAQCYIEHTFQVQAKFAIAGSKHDISYSHDNREIKVQVKGVSAHSQTRTIAPLNLEISDNEIPFDYLYLISLNEDFMPNGFYINTFEDLVKKANGKTKVLGSTMKGSSNRSGMKNGSEIYNFSQNKIDLLLEAIKEDGN